MTQSQKPVVTRFAPSPTGFLHIGGARTALFNWLYARHCGGQFLVRIEDTDKARSTKEAVAAIFEGLSWLGLKSDQEVVYQSSREARHKDVVYELMALGQAYRCYMTPEETEAQREAAHAQGHALRSPWRDKTPSSDQEALPYVIRFKGPLEAPVVIQDQVQGEVIFNAKTLDDLILMRSDGTPTYNLAVVVDDHDMGVTHIIRGDDHLNNAARQTLIYQALNWDVPKMAHIPLIHGPDGAKLSKRHGAQAVGDYQSMGYLPEAMRNYLMRLGWSHGDEELFDDAQAILWFDTKDINKAPSRLDFAKLGHINAHWMRMAKGERLVDLVAEHLGSEPELDLERIKPILQRTLPLIVERAQTVIELSEASRFAWDEQDRPLDEKTKNLLTEETLSRLGRLHENLLTLAPFDLETIDQFLKKFVENEGIGFGKLGPVLRGILCKGLPAPDISRVFIALGRETSLKRIKDTLFI